MDKHLKSVFELSPSPMLAVEKNSIIHANSKAEDFFGMALAGVAASTLIPEHILSAPSEKFVASAGLRERSCCISLSRVGDISYISFEPEWVEDEAPELINDSLMADMITNLCNLGLASKRLSEEMEDSISPKQERYLAVLNRSHYCLRRALTNLGTARMLREGTLHYSREVVDIARLCSDISSTAAILCADRGIDISFSTRHGTMYAWADPDKIERIILNLLSNAVSHSPRGGKISISLEKSGDTAFISVDDNGSGIPAHRLSGVFNAYRREKGEAALSSGSTGGLGLYVARGLAEGHGGAIIIESREDKGTSVRFVLPLSASSFSTLEAPSCRRSNGGMEMMLTELSSVLSTDRYQPEYMD